jgi:hypothetical protein
MLQSFNPSVIPSTILQPGWDRVGGRPGQYGPWRPCCLRESCPQPGSEPGLRGSRVTARIQLSTLSRPGFPGYAPSLLCLQCPSNVLLPACLSACQALKSRPLQHTSKNPKNPSVPVQNRTHTKSQRLSVQKSCLMTTVLSCLLKN